MRALLDTSALSELLRDAESTRMTALLRETDYEDAFVSVISIGEIAFGIRILPEGKRRAGLERWFVGLAEQYRERLLGIDGDVALRWATLRGDARRRGVTIAEIDGLIAATALEHDLTVVTRNARDFVPTGAKVFDPWA